MCKKKEELSQKKEEESERITELNELKVEHARAETVIANQNSQLLKQQLQIEKDSSQANIQQLQTENKQLLTRIESLENVKSSELATNKPMSSQTSPTLVGPPPLCMDHQTSQTESSASTSSLRHSTGTQNSLTESTGAPSRSTSRDIEQDTGITKTEANVDTQPGRAGFTISDSTLDLPKLPDTPQDKDNTQAS